MGGYEFVAAFSLSSARLMIKMNSTLAATMTKRMAWAISRFWRVGSAQSTSICMQPQNCQIQIAGTSWALIRTGQAQTGRAGRESEPIFVEVSTNAL